jgi:hypothetical protein
MGKIRTDVGTDYFALRLSFGWRELKVSSKLSGKLYV